MTVTTGNSAVPDRGCICSCAPVAAVRVLAVTVDVAARFTADIGYCCNRTGYCRIVICCRLAVIRSTLADSVEQRKTHGDDFVTIVVGQVVTDTVIVAGLTGIVEIGMGSMCTWGCRPGRARIGNQQSRR